MAKKLKIRQVHSGIGRQIDQKRTLRALGFTKCNTVVEHDDTPQIRGMVNKINHLVEIVE